MAKHKREASQSFMTRLATFIVDKRSLILLLTVIGLIFSAFSRNWVEVENDLTYYLPEDSETKQALNIMEEQFTTYGTADVMRTMFPANVRMTALPKCHAGTRMNKRKYPRRLRHSVLKWTSSATSP